MITLTAQKLISIFNPFDCPVAAWADSCADISGARAWSGEIDEETLAENLADTSPLPVLPSPEIEAEQFEQLYTWFLA